MHLLPPKPAAAKPLPLPALHIVPQFKCNVPLELDTDKFVVRTVRTGKELKRALQLRYEVFYSEIDRAKLQRIDRDRFDGKCDHLVVIEKQTGDFIATYRLFCSTFTRKFYSETEFDIEAIKALPGDKLELGRACVRKDYRKGVMIILLWRAISHYLKETGAQYLFGCSSVKTLSIPEIAKIHAILAREHLSPPQYRVTPLPKHRIKGFAEYLAPWQNVQLVDPKRTIAESIPPLLHLYLDVGSMICGEPALDKSFMCADFLTLLDTQTMPEPARKRYNL
jgi:putative hemolysin